MQREEALSKMVPPSQRRAGKPMGGVIQIHVTRSCNESCYNCTQGSNLGGKTYFMSPGQFEQACKSLKGYFGIIGLFGGNPAVSPHFQSYCRILRENFPREKCGLWCNDPITFENAREARKTFNPAVSNLNVHLSTAAYERFKAGWPESRPFGLETDSRHSPCYVAMRDVLRLEDGSYNEERAWELISGCDINQHWSAAIGLFRGELRAWFCEIAMAQSILHQHESDYPDTGYPVDFSNGHGQTWWQLAMPSFSDQVDKHCHDCGVPLRGFGELAKAPDEPSYAEQCSVTHEGVYKLKRKGRRLELVTVEAQLGQKLGKMTKYLQNSELKGSASNGD